MKLAETAIEPYTINVSDSTLNDLTKRLETPAGPKARTWAGMPERMQAICATSAITGEMNTIGAARKSNSTDSHPTGRRSTARASISCMNAAKDLLHSRSFLRTDIPIRFTDSSN